MTATKEKVELILNTVQGLMRIQDWDISVEFVDDANMTKICKDFDNAGCCISFSQENRAELYVNVEAVENQGDGWYYTLIHEMYHVVLDDFNRECLRDKEEPDDSFILSLEKLTNKLTKTFTAIHPLESFDENCIEAEDEDGGNEYVAASIMLN